jgi:hypothetical protein
MQQDFPRKNAIEHSPQALPSRNNSAILSQIKAARIGKDRNIFAIFSNYGESK